MRKITRQNIFLIDGVGAATTATLLYFLLGSFASFLGVPKYLLAVLSAIALVYSAYSFTCHFLYRSGRLKRIREALRIIALLNIAYCILTTSLLFDLYASISALGMCYFVGEILLILLLAIVEIGLARQSS